MKKMTKKQRDNKNRGMGKKSKNPSVNTSVFSNERWIVTVPGTGFKPQAFLSEEKAAYVGAALATSSGKNVEIDHQTFNGQEWIS